MEVIGNLYIALPIPLTVSDLENLSGGDAVEIEKYYRVRSDMISISIKGLITKTSLNKVRLHRGVYKCKNSRRIISNYGPTLIYLLFKIINPAKNIGVSNLKDEIDKATLDKFGNNVKELLDEIYSNYSIILNKVEHHDDYVRHIFRDIFVVTN